MRSALSLEIPPENDENRISILLFCIQNLLYTFPKKI